MEKIILDYTFDFKQKAILFILGSLPVLSLFKIVSSGSSFFNDKSLFSILLIISFNLVLLLVLLAIIFSKRGLMVKKELLFLSYSFMGKTIYTKNISLDEKKAFTFLKQKIMQKNTFLSSPGADLSFSDVSYNLVLLNKYHTKKEQVISLNSDIDLEELKVFLENFTNLKHEVYSPDFSQLK